MCEKEQQPSDHIQTLSSPLDNLYYSSLLNRVSAFRHFFSQVSRHFHITISETPKWILSGLTPSLPVTKSCDQGFM
jgi:hypothetical protein